MDEMGRLGSGGHAATVPMDKEQCLVYNAQIQHMREVEYPMLKDTIYLDHAGTTLYPKSLIERFSNDLISNLYGNPHSASQSSQHTARRIDDIRLRLLQFFKADPDEFDLVFVANATAGIKLVMEGFQAQRHGFWYGYHRDAHTSLVGVRESAREHHCFVSDQDVESWLSDLAARGGVDQRPGLFAYPAQSNMNGRRPPLDWCKRIRSGARQSDRQLYTLLDTAALVSTSPLDLSDVDAAPDFTVMSLYKVFGFPDLGVLIVRKASGDMLLHRKYFGGGTVDMVVCLREEWHARKSESLHAHLEDGTLPIHSILAVDHGLSVHRSLFGPFESVARHTAFLGQRLHEGLASLRHGNGQPVCKLYSASPSLRDDERSQGPIVAFNIWDKNQEWISNTEVEKLAAVRNVQFRTGSLCNPGGVAHSLGLAPWEMKQNFTAGQRCGSENDVMNGKPTGMIRLSLGAMSTLADVDAFLRFMNEFFVDTAFSSDLPQPSAVNTSDRTFYVESLTIYPVKSCAGWQIPSGKSWPIRREGLAWDREWCLVHAGTGTALNQKRYPKMALLRPRLDLEEGLLRVRFGGNCSGEELTIPLSDNPAVYTLASTSSCRAAKVCDDTVPMRFYSCAAIDAFFTTALGVPCQLARFPATGSAFSSVTATRHAKEHMLQRYQQRNTQRRTARMPVTLSTNAITVHGGPGDGQSNAFPILLSNESPILTISRSSLNRLNEQIKANGGKAAHHSVFRANILLAEEPGSTKSGFERPYIEDSWSRMRIGRASFRLLGGCRRCQMVCIDQTTAERNQEPFSTLAKTRRMEGRVFFGVHTCPTLDLAVTETTIAVGERVWPATED